jgi:ATP-dependent Lon protease
LAALRGGIKTVLIPQDNAKDLDEIPDDIKGGLEVIPVSHIDEVLKHALTKPLVPIEWDDLADLMIADKEKDDDDRVSNRH